jgi:hypothetical protein
MKKFIVEQLGYVQLEATRMFVVEVPDHISEEQAQELLEDLQEPLPDEGKMAWWDEPDRSWSGYDVEFTETEVYDPETVVGGPKTDGLTVVRLKGLDKDTDK